MYIPKRLKYMISSHHQIIGQRQNIVTGNLSFEEVENLKYQGVTAINTNDICEEIKRKINMGNACYYLREKILSSRLLSKNLKVNTYKTIILTVVLYGCETCSLTLKEEQRLRALENKVLRKIFGTKRDEITGEWRKLHNIELHAVYYSLEKILSSRLLSNNLKVNTYRLKLLYYRLYCMVVKLCLSPRERRRE